MGTDDLSKEPDDIEQLNKYAKALSRLHKAERGKTKELDDATRQLEKYAESINKSYSLLKEKNRELREAYLDTIQKLVLAAEYKDEDTGDHIVRISRYSALIAEKAGMSTADIENILYAAPMHDIGKIGIPDSILLKPSKLTDDEFETMKSHTTIGASILANSKPEILKIAQQIAISHHEKYNGKGYPQGLSGDKIPITGKIVGLVDVFDALTSRRPYKEPYPVEVACDIISKERGEHFDPELADIFLDNIDEIITIKAEVGLADDVSLADFKWSERDSTSLPL